MIFYIWSQMQIYVYIIGIFILLIVHNEASVHI